MTSDTQSKKWTQDDRFAVKLAMAAALAAIICIAFLNSIHFRHGTPIFAYILIPIVAAIVTFMAAKFGLKLKQKGGYSRWGLTFIGGAFGLCAYLVVATATSLFFINPKHYARIAPTLFTTSFILGGFLGPLFGAIIGFKKSKPPQ